MVSKAKIARVEHQQPQLIVQADSVVSSAGERIVRYEAKRTSVKIDPTTKDVLAGLKNERFELKTDLKRPAKLGLLLVGLGGNNGSTLYASILAHTLGTTWQTKRGVQAPSFYGSLVLASSMLVGQDEESNEDVYVPISQVAPFVDPKDLVIHGWDINGANMAEAVERAQVLEPDLVRQLRPHLVQVAPLPSYYHPDYIASNQKDRANNCLHGSKAEILQTICADIRAFKQERAVDKVVVMWTANTERFTRIDDAVHLHAADLLRAIGADHPEISPSTLFAVAAIQEGCTFINGSPQNTLVPAVVELAEASSTPIAGDDFKSGQTKLKSVLADFLVASGIKPLSIVSYNHLGNNDGKNLAEAAQFRSKEISKSNVIDDILAACPLYAGKGKEAVAPDHRIVIEYIPAVGDSKRALDEYESEIFMGGRSTISIHNVCEDSLLAAPLMLDLVLLAELLSRVSVRRDGADAYAPLHPVLSLLSFMLKAPMVPRNTPVINAFVRQRRAIESFLRAINGLPAVDDLSLSDRLAA